MFGCDECHPRLFQARRGANKTATMDDMEIGLSCGACHKKEKDELDVLNNSLLDMQEKLSVVVKMIRENSQQIQDASNSSLHFL